MLLSRHNPYEHNHADEASGCCQGEVLALTGLLLCQALPMAPLLGSTSAQVVSRPSILASSCTQFNQGSTFTLSHGSRGSQASLCAVLSGQTARVAEPHIPALRPSDFIY